MLASPHLLGTRVFSVLSQSCYLFDNTAHLLKCKSVEVGKDSFQPACFKHHKACTISSFSFESCSQNLICKLAIGADRLCQDASQGRGGVAALGPAFFPPFDEEEACLRWEEEAK